jgi:ubiquitin fusion degradation protein 1
VPQRGSQCLASANSSCAACSKPRIITNDTQIGDKKVPAALNLPFGKLFFGYDFVEPADLKAKAEAEEAASVSGPAPGVAAPPEKGICAPRPKTEAKAAKPESKPRRLDGRAVPDVIEIDSD